MSSTWSSHMIPRTIVSVEGVYLPWPSLWLSHCCRAVCKAPCFITRYKYFKQINVIVSQFIGILFWGNKAVPILHSVNKSSFKKYFNNNLPYGIISNVNLLCCFSYWQKAIFKQHFPSLFSVVAFSRCEKLISPPAVFDIFSTIPKHSTLPENIWAR